MAGTRQRSGLIEWRQHWPLVAAAVTGVSLSTVPPASLGVMMVPVEQDLGWTRTQISLGTSLVSLIGMTLATAAGFAIDRLGARLVAICAAMLMCGGIALMSSVGSSLWQWWGLWALVGMAASAMPTVWITPVAGLFTAGRGLAIAVTLSGSGIATSLVPILANRLVEDHGWRTAYLGLAGTWALLVLPLVLLFFHDAKSSRPAESADSAAQAVQLHGLTAREGFTSFTFYRLALAAFLSMSAGVALILNLVPVLRSTGLTPATAAWVAGIIGIATITGRLIGGFLMDRISAAAIAALSSAGAALLPIGLLVFPGSTLASAAGVAIYGLLGGAKVPAVAYLASRHFGARAFGTLYGAVNTTIALGVGLGPVVANYVYDVTHSYVPVMWAAIPFLLVAALLYATLGRYPDFRTEASPAGSTG